MKIKEVPLPEQAIESPVKLLLIEIKSHNK